VKRLLIILVVLLSLCSTAGAVRTIDCNWIWNADLATATEDAPDYVYCDVDGDGTFTSMGATYAIEAAGATYLTIQPDTVTTTQNGISMCTNDTTININLHGAIDASIFDEGGVYYYQITSFADDAIKTYGITPSAPYIKLTLGEAAAGVSCGIVRTSVSYEQ